MVAHLLFPALLAGAQANVSTAPVPVPVVADSAEAYLVPAGLPVEIELVDEINSKTAAIDAMFPIRLRTAIQLGDAVVVPAGTLGMGQIVHAARARGGGKPGELVLAVRYLDTDGRRLPLRRLVLGGTAGDRTGTAMALSIVVHPLAALLVSGGEKIFPAGSVASALVAADTAIAKPH